MVVERKSFRVAGSVLVTVCLVGAVLLLATPVTALTVTTPSFQNGFIDVSVIFDEDERLPIEGITLVLICDSGTTEDTFDVRGNPLAAGSGRVLDVGVSGGLATAGYGYGYGYLQADQTGYGYAPGDPYGYPTGDTSTVFAGYGYGYGYGYAEGASSGTLHYRFFLDVSAFASDESCVAVVVVETPSSAAGDFHSPQSSAFVPNTGLNLPPDADAGPDQAASEGAAVTLDATGSSDPDGDPLVFSWVQIAGPAVSLSDAASAQPTFVAPQVDADGFLEFRLQADDGTWDDTDVVRIHVLDLGDPGAPTADAGPDQVVDAGAAVTLDGSASSDPDGDPLDFLWIQIDGPRVEALTGTDTAAPSFDAPAVPFGREVVFQLRVSDGESSAADTVRITIESLPIATETWYLHGTDGQSGVGAVPCIVAPDQPQATRDMDRTDADHEDPCLVVTQDTLGLGVLDHAAVGPSQGFPAGSAIEGSVFLSFALPDPLAVAGSGVTVDLTWSTAAGTVASTTVALDESDILFGAGSMSFNEVAFTATTTAPIPADDSLLLSMDVQSATALLYSVGYTAPDNSLFTLTAPTPPPNGPPEAAAAAASPVAPGAAVALDATASSDPDGDALAFSWTQVHGPTVAVSDASSDEAGFVAPAVSEETLFSFRVLVDDGSTTDVAVVDVLVDPAAGNAPPVADAGPDQVVVEGDVVDLAGSGSDPDGDALGFLWQQTAGPLVAITDASSGTASFTAPEAPAGHSRFIEVRLGVTDGFGTGEDTILVEVLDIELVNSAPVADAGPDAEVDEGTSVSLDGTASSDADGDVLSFSWTQTTGPSVALDDPSSATPSFTAPEVDADETLAFQLLVSDGELMDTDTVVIVVRDVPPTDSDGDGVPDDSDVCPGHDDNADEDGDGVPDGCDSDAPDSDGDGVVDSSDNCPNVANAGQEDLDGDGIGDACDSDTDGDGVDDGNDNCPDTANAGQEDLDGDGVGDACDSDTDGDGVPDDSDVCPGHDDNADEDGDGVPDGCDSDAPDSDGDGVVDSSDNCPNVANAGQEDLDGDGVGDACDSDIDGDGVDDGNDNCPDTANAGQEDLDGDGVGDACDSDIDGDGVDDGNDNCPDTANAGQEDLDGDGIGDACDSDTDGDGVPNDSDVCPGHDDSADADGDGVPDGCDPDAPDADGDGVADSSDNCPNVANAAQEDLDGDGVGDACDSDIDGDGVPNDSDVCPGHDDSADADGDGVPDGCDSETPDADGDGVADSSDNCPNVANAAQEDLDGDGIGDACDSDTDGDGVADSSDNCPNVANAGQQDLDGDGVGDACDSDTDGDGVPDSEDSFPEDASKAGDSDGDGVDDLDDACPGHDDSVDTDGDGVPDGCDSDDDGDGVDDADDICEGGDDTKDLDGDGVPDACDEDSDGDGVPDRVEVKFGTEADASAGPDFDITASLEVRATANGNVLTWTPPEIEVEGYLVFSSNSPFVLIADVGAGINTYTDVDGRDSTVYKVTFYVEDSVAGGKVGSGDEVEQLAGWQESESRAPAFTPVPKMGAGLLAASIAIVAISAAILVAVIGRFFVVPAFSRR